MLKPPKFEKKFFLIKFIKNYPQIRLFQHVSSHFPQLYPQVPDLSTVMFKNISFSIQPNIAVQKIRPSLYPFIYLGF